MLVEYDFGMDMDIDEGKVVLFVKDYSLPSQAMEPVIISLSEHYDDIYFVIVSADELGTLSENYNIRHCPTILFLNDGTALYKIQGVISQNNLKEKIQHIFQ